MVRLDLATIGEASRHAAGVRRVFDDSTHSSDVAADACGHPGLADAVHGFASTWDVRRERFGRDLGAVAARLRDIEQAFRELDRAMAPVPSAGAVERPADEAARG